MSSLSEVKIPDYKECISLKELSVRNLEKVYSKLKKCQSEEHIKLSLNQNKFIFVPYSYLDFHIDCIYEYEASDTREEPYTEYVRRYRTTQYTAYEDQFNSPGGWTKVPVIRNKTESYTEPVTKWRTIEFNRRKISGSTNESFSKAGLSTSEKEILQSSELKSNQKNQISELNNFISSYFQKIETQNINFDNHVKYTDAIKSWINNYTEQNEDLIASDVIFNDLELLIKQIDDSEIEDLLFKKIKSFDAQGDINRDYKVSFSKKLITVKTIYIPFIIQKYSLKGDESFNIVTNLVEEFKYSSKESLRSGIKIISEPKSLLKRRDYNFFRFKYVSPLYSFFIFSSLNIFIRSVFTKINFETMKAKNLLSNDLFFSEIINQKDHYVSPTIVIVLIGFLLLIYNWLYQANKEKSAFISQNKKIFEIKKEKLLNTKLKSILKGCDLSVNNFDLINEYPIRRLTKIYRKKFSTNSLIIFFGLSTIGFDLIFSFFNIFTFVFSVFLWLLITAFLYRRTK